VTNNAISIIYAYKVVLILLYKQPIH